MKRIYLILTFCALTVSSMFAAASFQYLQIDPNGGTNTMPAHNLIYDVGASFVLTPPVRAGYTFAGWTGDGAEFISRNSAIQGSSSEELTFNGTEDTYYNLGRDFMYTTKITVNLWAYMDNWADYGANTMRMISCTQSGGWGIESSNGDIQFTMYDAGASGYKKVTSSTLWSALSAGWHMFTMTFDGRNMYGYIDGVMHGATKIFKGDIGYNATNVIQLGAEASADATPAGSYFKGKIKDVSIVKCWMTSAEVSSLYANVSNTNGDNALVTRYYMPNGNKSLKATWTANAATQLTIDANGGVNTMASATYSQAAGTSIKVTNPTKAGSVFKHWDASTSPYISNYQEIPCSSPTEVTFNGTSTYYDLGRTYMYKDKITVNIWAYMSNWADYVTNKNRLISCTQGGGWNWELNGNKIRAAIYDAGKGGYNSVLIEKNWSSLASGWHMFTIVFDGTRAHAYIDGVHMGQSEPFQGQIGYHAANSILLGAEATTTAAPDTGFGFFKGKMKNVSIMHTAITPEDVTTLYNNNGATYYYFQDAAKTLKAVWEGTSTPTISTNTNSVNFETVEGTTAANQIITVSTANLTGNITATLSGTDASVFTISPASLGSTGGTITISYNQTAVGSHTATLTLAATGAANQVINLKGVVTAKATEPETPVTGPLTADKMSVNLTGKQYQSPAPYVDVNVTCTGLTSSLSFNPSTGAVTVAALEGWNEQTGGTLRITLNTTKAIGDYSGYVAVQSGSTANRIEIQVAASITEGDAGTVITGPIVADPMTVELVGTYGSTDVVYKDVKVTATDLTADMVVVSSTSSVTAATQADWNPRTGGTIRLTLNTNFSLGIGEYTEYVAVQSGADKRIEIGLLVTLRDPETSDPDAGEEPEPTPDPETPSYDFDATPTLTKVWETANVLASADARYGTGYNGKVYAVDATNKILYSWDAEGCTKTEVKTGIGGGWACTVDEAGNLLTNTGKWTSSFTDWQIYDIDAATQTALTISVPSGVTTGYIYANVAVAGDVTSDAGGTMYLAPAGQKVAAKVVLQNSAILSAEAAATATTAFTNEDQLAIANVDYSALTNESFIWRNRGGKTNYILGGIESTHAEPAGETTNSGFATFMLNNVEYGVCPTGTYEADGFSVYQLLDGAVVGARTESKAGADQHASFRAEKVSEGEVNIYFYKAGVSCGMYKFAYPTTGTGGGVATDIESTDAAFGCHVAEHTLFVTGVEVESINLFAVTGQRVCSAQHTNMLSLEGLHGVFAAVIVDAEGNVYTQKIACGK